MAADGQSYQDRSHPRPVVTVQRALVTHGKRAAAPIARVEAARVIPRIALSEGQGVPNVRRGGIVRAARGEAPFELWSLPHESVAA
ncbi:MAG: hypothetical protein GC172_00150 [Phycisphaera sp.]|nr:hypothetical protein [Phycisphaera sp.]